MSRNGGDCLYARLDVPKDASQEDIRKAYKKLALQCHPDRTHGDKVKEEEFKNINHAYGILSDADARRQYDMFGEDQPAMNIDDILHDIMSDISYIIIDDFSARNLDPDYIDIQISLADLHSGAPRQIEFDITDRCSYPNCSERKRVACMLCGGRGGRNCSGCHGQCSVPNAAACPSCRGSLTETVKRKMSVPLPPNFKNKQILTYDGQGSYDPHAKAYKDLYIQLHHALPKGVKLDLAGGVHVNVPVTLADVFLGFHKVLSLYGEPVDVICEGPVDPSLPIVVKERGLPLPTPIGARSAIIVHLVVSYPKREDMAKMRPFFEKIFKKHGPVAGPTHPNPIVL